jgi:hypothetical protein
MLKIIATFLGFSLIGALFASNLIDWPLRPGYLAAGLLVGLALFARRHWRELQRTGRDPSISERRIWLTMAGTAMICAYVIVVLATPARRCIAPRVILAALIRGSCSRVV